MSKELRTGRESMEENSRGKMMIKDDESNANQMLEGGVEKAGFVWRNIWETWRGMRKRRW